MQTYAFRRWAGLCAIAFALGAFAAAAAAENAAGAVYEKILSGDAMTAKNLGVKCVGFAGELTGKLAPANYDGVGACTVWETAGTRARTELCRAQFRACNH